MGDLACAMGLPIRSLQGVVLCFGCCVRSLPSSVLPLHSFFSRTSVVTFLLSHLPLILWLVAGGTRDWLVELACYGCKSHARRTILACKP